MSSIRSILSTANHIFNSFLTKLGLAITCCLNHPTENSLLNAFLNVNNFPIVTIYVNVRQIVSQISVTHS